MIRSWTAHRAAPAIAVYCAHGALRKPAWRTLFFSSAALDIKTMTDKRLYYTDAYLIEFDALVCDVVQRDDRWQVTLDRTAFYPTSGGQPFDIGTLDEANVLDVVDREDGTIGHLIDRPLE